MASCNPSHVECGVFAKVRADLHPDATCVTGLEDTEMQGEVGTQRAFAPQVKKMDDWYIGLMGMVRTPQLVELLKNFVRTL